ncbi:SDR family NAD(P)-dependent oxidoreductase [Loktanella sp. SALINAS62]|uniref:SDR family NAD(P)-dependent oxidoreductase n=1 Tax=Loktanella sp. SALINAS62 TaxID=2706124 RepID=UPI001B8BDB04|nr:SDR family NAD(P)-dependent oxidoreductase [Loktanella sp. SALINAS62]MBS1304063.1 SDR family NAD(P)-dependent oxidoreductase [Loktanella sp. SALINAS62]
MPNNALVIGASGGIGSAIVAELRTRGDRVTTLSRRNDGFDVTDPASVATALDSIDGTFDLIFVAVGILGTPEKKLTEIDAGAMAHLMAVNAIGPALIMRHAARLLPRDRPSVCAVLSARVGSIGDNRVGGWYSYRASKAALNQIVHGAAIELGRTHKQSTVVALHPGTVETPFTAAYAGHNKTVAPDTAAANLLSVIDAVGPGDSGGFFDYAHERIVW